MQCMWSCLLLDFKNAFNNISHQHIFAEARSRLQGLPAWMECCYGTQPILHFGDFSASVECSRVTLWAHWLSPWPCTPSWRGSRTRYPPSTSMLGTLMTALFVAPLLTLLEPSILWREDGPARGLHLNRRKSLLFISQDAAALPNPLPADIPSTAELGLLPLWSPG